MIRQSLRTFLKSYSDATITENAMKKAMDYSFHHRIRNELIMLPIPKAKMFERKLKLDQNLELQRNKIYAQQKHCLAMALNRVSFNYKK